MTIYHCAEIQCQLAVWFIKMTTTGTFSQPTFLICLTFKTLRIYTTHGTNNDNNTNIYKPRNLNSKSWICFIAEILSLEYKTPYHAMHFWNWTFFKRRILCSFLKRVATKTRKLLISSDYINVISLWIFKATAC